MALFEYTSQYRVAYADTDQMGVVYYANYLVMFERARTEMLRARGLDYAEMERQGIALPVGEARARYHASAHYDDILDMTAAVESIKGARMVLSYRICRNGQLLCDGETTLVFMNMARGRAMRAPEFVLQLFDLMEKPAL